MPGVHAEKGGEAVAELGRQVGPLVDAYVTALEGRKLKDGIRIAMSISSLGTLVFHVLQMSDRVKEVAVFACPESTCMCMRYAIQSTIARACLGSCRSCMP